MKYALDRHLKVSPCFHGRLSLCTKQACFEGQLELIQSCHVIPATQIFINLVSKKKKSQERKRTDDPRRAKGSVF